MNALQRAEQRMQHEMDKWIDLNHCALALVLFREYGYRQKRIQSVENEIEETWQEVAASNDVSMIQLLDEETGIELRNHEHGKSWRELAFLNSAIKMDPKRMKPAQWIVMRNHQAEWMRQQTLACILVGMHRKYGWGFDRLARLIEQMSDIIDIEVQQNPKLIKELAKKEVNFHMKGEIKND